MRAAVQDRYGPPEVVAVRTVAAPEPGPHEVRVKVFASSVSSADSRVRALRVPRGLRALARLGLGITRPRAPIRGTDLAGMVDVAGAEVSGLAPGDAVIASTGVRSGGHAEYACLDARRAVVKKPPGLGWDVAAALPFGALTALTFLRDLGSIRAGHELLVFGAAGAVGSAAVQLGKHFGARVTAVGSPRNLGLLHSLGADVVIDRMRTDFTEGPRRFDLVLETIGVVPFVRCRRVVKPGGRVLAVAGPASDFVRMLWTRFVGDCRLVAGMASERRADLQLCVDLAASGVLRPVIDRTFVLDDVVAAHHYVDLGHKAGNVLLLPNGPLQGLQ
jgi:NADPH:quinone reductase-like Zn-dependent oxidoreductase